MIYLFLLLILPIGFLAVESVLNQRRVKKIKHRIYVNGTRGKSSVTRLIAGALREGGVKTIAKTTGSSPRFIYPDGSEVLIRRISSANIKEQLKTLKWATKFNLDAVVIECMALQPYTQWISDKKMVQSTIGVITNVRADHLDVMGPTVLDIEKAFCGTVPKKGICITAEPVYVEELKKAARENRTTFIQVSESDIQSVTPDELNGFTYIEHPENIALALKVTELFSIPRDIAIKGMQKAIPDIGVLRINRVSFFSKMVYFLNGFAANDVDSYRILWKRLSVQFSSLVDSNIIVVNCRDDRPDRSVQLAEFASEIMSGVKLFIIIGTGTEIFARATQKYRIPPEKVYIMIHQPPEKIFERVISLIKEKGLVFGIGNIKGDGKVLGEFFANRSS